MIVLACSVFMVYEWFAQLTHRPTITDLSRRRPWGLVVWAWLIWLALHFGGRR